MSNEDSKSNGSNKKNKREIDGNKKLRRVIRGEIFLFL